VYVGVVLDIIDARRYEPSTWPVYLPNRILRCDFTGEGYSIRTTPSLITYLNRLGRTLRASRGLTVSLLSHGPSSRRQFLFRVHYQLTYMNSIVPTGIVPFYQDSGAI